MKLGVVFLTTLVALAVVNVELASARRTGGGGGRSRGSSLGSLFGSGSKSKTSNNPQSSYPKQTWSQSGTGTGTGGSYGGNKQGTNLGGGGYANPSGGGGLANPSGAGGYYGGGNKQGSYGGSQGGSYGGGSYGNNYAGGSIGGGGFVNPGGNRGWSSTNIGRTQGYYGTGGQSIFGNSYSSYNHRSPFGGFSGSKGLAVGAGAGFIGGAVAGVAAVSMYHQYRQYQMLMHCYGNPGCYGGYGGYGGYGYGGRRILLNAEDCEGGCPNQAYCDYGVCRCRDGYEARYGACFKTINDFNTRQSDWNNRLNSGYNPYHGCSRHVDCRDVDMNMVCKTGKCACRNNMKWNDEVHECQIFVDVDCSDVDVNNSGPTAAALTDVSGANGTLHSPEYEYDNSTMEFDDADGGNSTEAEEPASPFDNPVNVTSLTANETLADSELTKLNPNTTTPKEIKSAFCREVARTARIYSPPPERTPVNRGESGGIGTGVTVVIVIAAIGVVGCLLFGVAKMCKGGSRRPKSGRDDSDDDDDRVGNQAQPNMMAFSALNHEPPPYSTNDQGGYPQVPVPYPPGPDNPYMNAGGPAPYPPVSGAPAYPPYPQAPGDAAPGAPYPPAGAPYPPAAAPYPAYPPGPYPPQGNPAPYPPQGPGYPPYGN